MHSPHLILFCLQTIIVKRYIYILLAILLSATSVNAMDRVRAFIYYYDQPNGLYDYFIKTSDNTWEEMDLGKNIVKFHFRTVSEDGEQTILFDGERNLYIRLTASGCYVGDNKTSANRKLYDGYWTTAADGLSAMAQMNKGADIFIYEKKERRGYFVKKGSQWLEYTYSNGLLVNSYSVISQKPCCLILFNKRGGYYVKLTSTCCCYSTSENGEYTRMYGGRWTGKGLEKGSGSASSKSRSGGENAFAYYLKGKTGSYHGYYWNVSGTHWEEVRLSDDKVLFRYTFVSESSDGIILSDDNRTVFVRLTDNESYWGSTKNDITHKVYDGVWTGFDYGYSVSMLMEIDINIFYFESSSYSGYYSRSAQGYWIEYGYSGGYPVNTYIIIEEQPTFLILFCSQCGRYVKLTEDGIYYSDSKDGHYEKKADGKWSKGKVQNGPEKNTKMKPKEKEGNAATASTGTPSSATPANSKSASGVKTGATSSDPLTALKAHVRDSLTHLMKLSSLTNKAIADKKIDKKNLETVAADIARQYLATLKKNAIKKFNGKAAKISAYDKQKQVYTIIWNSDIFTVTVPLAESESFKTNWGKMTFTEPDFFFDGSKFRLSALKITNPVLKKTYSYDSRGQKKQAPVLKVNDLDVVLPAS